MKSSFYILSTFIIILTCKDAAVEATIFCHYSNTQPQKVEPEIGTVYLSNNTVRCDETGVFCYALWASDPHDKNVVKILLQGCWLHTEEGSYCSQDACQSNLPPRPIQHLKFNTSKFCCCHSHMCNANVSDIYVPTKDTGTVPVSTHIPQPNYRVKTIITSLVSVFCVAVVIFLVFLVYRLCLSRQHRHSNGALMLTDSQSSPDFEIDDLKLCTVISKGHYSEVMMGLLHEREVAIKIYTSQHRQYYQNEKYLYSLPLMNHDNILTFLGADERLTDTGMTHMLVLMYMPLGTLSGYLKNNKLDWPVLCKILYSMARGMAHLHTDITKGDSFKPVIAHRDFNSRNVLMKSDLTCVICDLGFAMATSGSKLIKNGVSENAEQSSLTDIGTLRYMAPELLDGAVNLRDCESALKQIDIYALGLVLWEAAVRCTDLYQDVWRDSNQAVRSLKETIDDCWDQDAEARLTALCVEERISEMITLWSHDTRLKTKGVTPTINPVTSDLAGYAWQGNTLTEEISPADPTDDSTATLLGNRSGPGPRQSWMQDCSVSTSTTDTLLSPSESESTQPPPPLKSDNINQARKNMALQPHQGRNPTVERNTHKRSDEELAISGNTLVNNTLLSSQIASSAQIVDNLFDSVADNMETSLVQNDSLSHHRNTPIPYLQNQVHGDLPASVRPKVANVSGNGNLPYSKLTVSEARSQKSKFLKLKKAKLSQLGLFAKNSLSKSHQNIDESSARSEAVAANGHHRSNSDSVAAATAEHKRNIDPESEYVVQNENRLQNGVLSVPVETAVQLQNGHAVVIPMECRKPTKASEVRYPENRLGFAEVGIAKLDFNPNCGNASAVTVKNNIQMHLVNDTLVNDTGPQLSSWLETDLIEAYSSQSKRPTSLALRGHDYIMNKANAKSAAEGTLLYKVVNEGEDSGEKIKGRIKTPLALKKSRFSLYDDRIMISSANDQTNEDHHRCMPRMSVSLQQFKDIGNDVQDKSGSTVCDM